MGERRSHRSGPRLVLAAAGLCLTLSTFQGVVVHLFFPELLDSTVQKYDISNTWIRSTNVPWYY